MDRTVTCNEKRIMQDNWQQPAQWLDWEVAPKHFPKPNLHQRKVLATVRWSAASLIDDRISEPLQKHYIREVCSANWWDAPKTAKPAAGTGQQKQPNSFPQQPDHTWYNQRFKSWTNWVTKFCHPPYSLDLSPTNSHLFKHLDNFWQGKCFYNQQNAENAF